MGWNDRGGTYPASERRVYAARGALLELLVKHFKEGQRLRYLDPKDLVGRAASHDRQVLKLLADVGVDNIEVKVDG